MKACKVSRSRVDIPKLARRRIYKDLEIAMEKRAIANRSHPNRQTEDNELAKWTEADADMLEESYR